MDGQQPLSGQGLVEEVPDDRLKMVRTNPPLKLAAILLLDLLPRLTVTIAAMASVTPPPYDTDFSVDTFGLRAAAVRARDRRRPLDRGVARRAAVVNRRTHLGRHWLFMGMIDMVVYLCRRRFVALCELWVGAGWGVGRGLMPSWGGPRTACSSSSPSASSSRGSSRPRASTTRPSRSGSRRARRTRRRSAASYAGARGAALGVLNGYSDAWYKIRPGVPRHLHGARAPHPPPP